MQELLKELKIKGQIVIADALNCQKETAEIIIKQKANYLLCVKDNHPNLKKDIEDYVQDSSLRSVMHTFTKNEKNRGRIETRTAFVTTDIDWPEQKKEWKSLKCIQAVNCRLNSFFIMQEWNGRLSPCTGFSMCILKRIGAESRVKMFSKA